MQHYHFRQLVSLALFVLFLSERWYHGRVDSWTQLTWSWWQCIIYWHSEKVSSGTSPTRVQQWHSNNESAWYLGVRPRFRTYRKSAFSFYMQNNLVDETEFFAYLKSNINFSSHYQLTHWSGSKHYGQTIKNLVTIETCSENKIMNIQLLGHPILTFTDVKSGCWHKPTWNFNGCSTWKALRP